MSAAVDFPGPFMHMNLFKSETEQEQGSKDMGLTPKSSILLVELFVVALAALNYFTFRAAQSCWAFLRNRSRCVSHVRSQNQEHGPNTWLPQAFGTYVCVLASLFTCFHFVLNLHLNGFCT